MIELNISIREPQFYNKLFKINIEGQAVSKYPKFTVTIGNGKETGEIEYGTKAPLVEYHHNDSNSCCFISLAYVFTMAG